jgi:hypothetical protein
MKGDSDIVIEDPCDEIGLSYCDWVPLLKRGLLRRRGKRRGSIHERTMDA